ncbi:pantoate--beta-alanine ligase [Pontibaca salina]|uniref:Pantothenate synthetase n=1 Tax=Pontibaca salina TaxID=2795731 RepID=A0A934LY72_9RHOB|nr:pantoate--beta-alanine ligase [Pontibaca salina]MBI6629442.1 pantoate--beta-alanine ligase [Pontibaca salina]
MKIIRHKAELRAQTRNWRAAGETIGVVPTMGALHQGHLGLVSAACARADRVIVTLFVNPRQFNNPEDLEKYPQTEGADVEKLAPFEIDVLYIPEPGQVYPQGFATTVSVSGVSEGLCGADRPGHFDGVATVVTKLLLQTDADFAFFGEKDFQQLQVVRRLVADLDINTQIIGCPTIREASGLALSSRNVRLGQAAQKIAPLISATLSDAAKALAAGQPVAAVLNHARQSLRDGGISSIDYLEFRRESDFAPIADSATSGRLLVAVWLDGVRLIDNIRVDINTEAT